MRKDDYSPNTLERSNINAVSCLKWLQLACIAVVIFNELNIFALEKMSCRIGCLMAFILLAIPWLFMKAAGPKSPVLPYISILTTVAAAFAVNAIIGYDSQLVYACPLLLSMQYTDFRISVTVFFLTLITMAAGLGTAFVLGNTDVDTVRLLVCTKIMPYWLMLVCILPFALKITQFRGRSERREAELQNIADHDPMTELYSKHKYEEMLNKVYINQENIGVVYFDVNSLKATNDTLGHNAGDMLITKAARSLRKLMSRTIYSYRMGGDEFVTVLTHCSEEDVRRYIFEWTLAMETENNIPGTIFCDVSYGYAYGRGMDIANLVKEADMKMYDMKQRKKRKQN